MKFISTLLILALGAAARADILYQFDFNTDGTLTDQGHWNGYSGPDGSVSNMGGVAWFGAGTEDVGATNAYAGQSGQVYLGLDLTIRENGSDTQHILGFMNGNGVMVGRLWVHTVDASTFNFALSGDGNLTSMWSQAFTTGVTYRVVLGYDASADEHTLWVDPGLSDEATPQFSMTEAVSSAPNGVYFRQSTTWGADLASWTVDDLAVATDFANAVGLVPEPGTLVFLALGAALLHVRRRLSAA